MQPYSIWIDEKQLKFGEIYPESRLLKCDCLLFLSKTVHHPTR